MSSNSHKYIKKDWKNGRWRYYYNVSRSGFNNGQNNQNNTTIENSKTGRYTTVSSGKSNSLGRYVGITTGGNRSGGNDYRDINKKVGNLTVSGEYSAKDGYLDVSIGWKQPRVRKAAAKGQAYVSRMIGRH